MTLVPESAPHVSRIARNGPTRSPSSVLDPPQCVSSSSYPQHGVFDSRSCANARAFQRSMRSGPKVFPPSGEMLSAVRSQRPS